MAGKYAHVIDKLPRLLGTEPAYQEKVEAVKSAVRLELDNVHGSTLAREYEGVRGEIDALESLLSDANLRLEAYSQLLVEQFEAEGVTSLKLASGRSVAVQYEPYAKVEDKEAFRLWCLKNGLEKSMTLLWATTNAITKERLLQGEPEPDGVTCHAKTRIVLRS